MDDVEKHELGNGPNDSATQPLPGTIETKHTCLPDDSSKETAFTTSASELEWDGPDDQENPHNWRFASKVYHVTVPGLFGFAV